MEVGHCIPVENCLRFIIIFGAVDDNGSYRLTPPGESLSIFCVPVGFVDFVLRSAPSKYYMNIIL